MVRSFKACSRGHFDYNFFIATNGLCRTVSTVVKNCDFFCPGPMLSDLLRGGGGGEGGGGGGGGDYG